MTDEPRVVLNLTSVQSGYGGLWRYASNMVQAFEQSRINFAILSREGDPRWQTLVDKERVLSVGARSRLLRLYQERNLIGKLAMPANPQVLHSVHYTTPDSPKIPTVVTLHDLSFYDFPEMHSRIKRHYFKHAIKVAFNEADAIVCVSKFTKDRLTENFGPRENLYVVENIVNPKIFTRDCPEADFDDKVLLKFGIDRPFLLYVGAIEPRKRVPLIVDTYFQAGLQRDFDLVLVGSAGWESQEFLKKLKKLATERRIIWLTALDDTRLASLYRKCKVFIYMSSYEGFGLPVVEALSCGCSIITRRHSAMEELGGKFVQTCDDFDFCEVLVKEINSTKAPDKFVGLNEWMDRFRPLTFAKRHSEIYKQTANLTCVR